MSQQAMQGAVVVVIVLTVVQAVLAVVLLIMTQAMGMIMDTAMPAGIKGCSLFRQNTLPYSGDRVWITRS